MEQIHLFMRMAHAANLFQQFKVKRASNDFGQQGYAETGQEWLVALEKLFETSLPHFVTSRLHDKMLVYDNFYLSPESSRTKFSANLFMTQKEALGTIRRLYSGTSKPKELIPVQLELPLF